MALHAEIFAAILQHSRRCSRVGFMAFGAFTGVHRGVNEGLIESNLCLSMTAVTEGVGALRQQSFLIAAVRHMAFGALVIRKGGMRHGSVFIHSHVGMAIQTNVIHRSGQ